MKNACLVCLLAAAGLLLDAGVAQADIIQSTPGLPPAGAYTSSDFCVQLGPGVCVVNLALFGFTGTTSIFNGSGQSIDSSISLTSNVYTDNGGNPGAFLGSLHLFGPIGILYSGRTSDTELGTFLSTLTELDLTGTFNGHLIELMLTAQPSIGSTTVTPDGSDFRVSSFFDVFAEVSIDHGAFVPGSERTFVLTPVPEPVPEPATLTLLSIGLAGLGFSRRRKR